MHVQEICYVRNFGISVRLGYCSSITKFLMASMWAISMVENREERNVIVSRKKEKDKLSKAQQIITIAVLDTVVKIKDHGPHVA